MYAFTAVGLPKKQDPEKEESLHGVILQCSFAIQEKVISNISHEGPNMSTWTVLSLRNSKALEPNFRCGARGLEGRGLGRGAASEGGVGARRGALVFLRKSRVFISIRLSSSFLLVDTLRTNSF